MNRSPFVTLIFRGARFQGAAMPLEALPELAAYRDLVLATARALYQNRHPERQRLPKGFDNGLRLVLDRVEAGSTTPLVSRAVPAPTVSPLCPDEEISVAPPGMKEGAPYNRAIRRKLILRTQATYESIVDLVGEIRTA